MKINELVASFVRHNTEGPARSHGTAGSYWYRGSVLYYSETPVGRIVAGPSPRKKKAVLCKLFPGWLADSTLSQLVNRVAVPDMGVFSTYEDDMLPEGEALNERVRYIMLQQIRKMLFETLPPYNGKQLSVGGEGDRLIEQMDTWYKDYDQYRSVVGGTDHWLHLPEMYRENLAAGIGKKIRLYKEPGAVLRRERSRARRVAMDALFPKPKKKKR